MAFQGQRLINYPPTITHETLNHVSCFGEISFLKIYLTIKYFSETAPVVLDLFSHNANKET